MNLLVDLGNTRLKWLLIDLDWLLIDPRESLNTSEKNMPSPHESGERATSAGMREVEQRREQLPRVRGSYTGSDASPLSNTSPVGGALLHGADFTRQLDDVWSKLAAPQRMVVASVAGADAQQHLQAWVQHHWPATRLHFVAAVAAQLGVKNSYREPARLGSDRWAALIGARARVTGPVCVVDCGTAITLDALDAAGEFVGGVILPGIALARQALLARAPGIAAVEGDDSSCFAHGTADGVAAGTLYGALGAVERIVAEFGLRLGQDMRVLLTGGDAQRLRPYLNTRLACEVEEVPDLVLQGLARIAESLK
jgi:type III pantothenate kinase